MKSTKLLFALALVIAISACGEMDPGQPMEEKPAAENREFIQLKTYTFASEAQEQRTDSYLKNAYLPALKKMNIGPVGVFKPRLSETDTVRKALVLIPFASMAQLMMLEDELMKDDAYLAAGSDFINAAYDQPTYQRMESVLMQAFTGMPQLHASALDGPRPERVYELRSYESATERLYHNKVDMFINGGEIQLFDRLEFNPVFYAEVISGPKMPNLMYLTTFSDQASREAHWKAFFEAPEWLELKAMPKYQNNVSHADITFLYPTEYSDY